MSRGIVKELGQAKVDQKHLAAELADATHEVCGFNVSMDVILFV